ncbi:MAG: hypothetical protein J2P41_19510, partial [Blastocatellia bacterium]|nr:hypothetical protein [Blastocatellia bacterium]
LCHLCHLCYIDSVSSFSFSFMSTLKFLLFLFLAVNGFAAENLQKFRTFHTAEEFQRLTAGRVKLYRSASNGFQFHRSLPNYEITVIAGDPANTGVLWIGTKRGMFSYHPSDDSIQYFAGKRWLPDDQVTGIGFEEGEAFAVWVETPAGFSRIEYRPMALSEKARAFEERVRARHVRHGLTASSRLEIPGELASSRMISTDNDGLWTAIYVAAECFRYRVTGEAAARENAREGMQALLRLEEITGIPGFPARSVIEIGVDEQPQDGEWHTTADGKWRWKGDTSSDEIVGHYFAYPIYYDLVADEDEKNRIRATVERITNHILDHGYQLIDVDGKRTTWGWWDPDSIWADPDETGLRALHLLSHLRVAIHISGQKKFQAAYQELIEKHRYHLLTRNQKINIPGRINHSDDELAFLSYYPLLLYEKDPNLRQVYLQSLERSWAVERPERNPLWNFIYAAVGAGSGAVEYDREESIRTLEEIPNDLVTWSVVNSRRLDLTIAQAKDRFKREQSLIVLPYDELPVMKWNGNPYRLDGGDGGRSEDDGAFFLLPYWLGRYHKLL